MAKAQSVDEVIAETTTYRNLIIDNWKASKEGRIFLEDSSLKASEVGYAEALRKFRLFSRGYLLAFLGRKWRMTFLR